MPPRALLSWYNKDIQAAKKKQHRRYFERLWIRTGLSVHYEMFNMARLYVINILATAKSEYYNNKIKKTRKLFSVVNKKSNS